jgi:mannose-1-phosphate guanylyltransferase
MTNQTNAPNRLWSIVLAGGEGGHVTPFIQRWLGRPRPKQFCTFVGSRSMLQHTLDRADQLTQPERKVTVIIRSHSWEIWPQLGNRPTGMVVVQPANRDTGAGILFPLTHIRQRDPQATVVIYPSDHFIHPEEKFIEAMRHAVCAAERYEDKVVLLGAPPDRLELDYGWIQPGSELGAVRGRQVRGVHAFWEKPTPVEADAAMTAGGLWNTMVMVAKVETLWNMGWQCFPEMLQLFTQLRDAIGTSKEAVVLESIYEVMPIVNFPRALLQRAQDHIAVVELTGVLWSDWGRPERITDSLCRIGKQPAFPRRHLRADADINPVEAERLSVRGSKRLSPSFLCAS